MTTKLHNFIGGKCTRCLVNDEIAAPQCILYCRCPDQCPIHVDIKAVMLQALEHIMEYFDNPDRDFPEIEDFKADRVFAEMEDAIRLAREHKMTRHTVNGDQASGWYCYLCPFFTRDVAEAAEHDGKTTQELIDSQTRGEGHGQG